MNGELGNKEMAEILESLNGLMLSNPDLYLRIAREELKNSCELKVLDVELKYEVNSDFVYIDISSPSVKNITNLGKIYRLNTKIGFTEDMLKPQIRICENNYREVRTLEELNTAELTVSFDNFCDKGFFEKDNVNTLTVEAVLHSVVLEKIRKDEMFKHYMVSIIHDRVLLKLRNQVSINKNEAYILDSILKKCKLLKMIPKYGNVNNIGFCRDNVEIIDVEFVKGSRKPSQDNSFKHTLSISCYKSYDELISNRKGLFEQNKSNSEFCLATKPIRDSETTKIVEEVEITNSKSLPTSWESIRSPEECKGIEFNKNYTPMCFKTSLNVDELIFFFKFKSTENLINNLDKLNAHVSNTSARISYDSCILLYLNLRDFVKAYHKCSLCSPTFNYKKCILFCNNKTLKVILYVENICSAVKHKLRENTIR
ncbi:hypothetical protein FG386_001134 [Cryptosporidium ryanae]|uniref:uncharacterized protein n=1 Tax=Cryptosporidium ryanae TaxID=515981 RepID=UPI003519DDD4|nr:hypothetical protein FG386_001134 [Cryptosporidium ryanae]